MISSPDNNSERCQVMKVIMRHQLEINCPHGRHTFIRISSLFDAMATIIYIYNV